MQQQSSQPRQSRWRRALRGARTVLLLAVVAVLAVAFVGTGFAVPSWIPGEHSLLADLLPGGLVLPPASGSVNAEKQATTATTDKAEEEIVLKNWTWTATP